MPRRLTEPLVMAVRKYSQEHPVSREVFQAYQSLYSYDRTPLDPVTESIDESDESWTKERITFQAGYGKERVIAHLFLPASEVSSSSSPGSRLKARPTGPIIPVVAK